MESTMMNMEAPAWFAAYANIRTDCYALLAALLTRAPAEDLLEILRNLSWEERIPKKLDEALGALQKAGRDFSHAAAEEEFNRLFVGLGCGGMLPYASWYREKKIQSLPLASLRSDLMALGVVRQADSHESEDHAGVLCEIMALLSRMSDDVSLPAQAGFFIDHLAPWMMTFFQDLQSAQGAEFYRVVGLVGSCFLEAESEYLDRAFHSRLPIKEGGWQNENRPIRQPADIS